MHHVFWYLSGFQFYHTRKFFLACCKMKLHNMIFSNIAYENYTFITQFSEENKGLHH
jgi:hypothetical protein